MIDDTIRSLLVRTEELEQRLDALHKREPLPDMLQPLLSLCRLLAFSAVTGPRRDLLEVLGDEVLQSIALMYLKGKTLEEMAAATQTTPRTIFRKLKLLREAWDAAQQ